tara:strand:+ start:1756 stop:1992 length:237 start_codon:yes stop_codon:yes gene_type:complete
MSIQVGNITYSNPEGVAAHILADVFQEATAELAEHGLWQCDWLSETDRDAVEAQMRELIAQIDARLAGIMEKAAGEDA